MRALAQLLCPVYALVMWSVLHVMMSFNGYVEIEDHWVHKTAERHGGAGKEGNGKTGERQNKGERQNRGAARQGAARQGSGKAGKQGSGGEAEEAVRQDVDHADWLRSK